MRDFCRVRSRSERLPRKNAKRRRLNSHSFAAYGSGNCHLPRGILAGNQGKTVLSFEFHDINLSVSPLLERKVRKKAPSRAVYWGAKCLNPELASGFHSSCPLSGTGSVLPPQPISALRVCTLWRKPIRP